MSRVTIALVALIGTITVGSLPSWDETRARAIAQHNTIAAITTSGGERSPQARAGGTLAESTDVSWMGAALRGELASAKSATSKVVRLASGPSDTADDATPAPSPSLSPSKSKSADIAATIQAELARVGCYTGAVDGRWSEGTRRAMQAFIESVNAMLPTAEPDFILLTLVRGHTGRACGAKPSLQTAAAPQPRSPSRIAEPVGRASQTAQPAAPQIAPSPIVTASIAKPVVADAAIASTVATPEPSTSAQRPKPTVAVRSGRRSASSATAEVRTTERPRSRQTTRREAAPGETRGKTFAEVARSDAAVRREKPAAPRPGKSSLYASVFDRISRNAP